MNGFLSKRRASLRPSSFNDIVAFRRSTAGDKVPVSVTGDTQWFMYVDNGGLRIGFCALMMLRTGVRIKVVWVKPELRGHGHGRQMTLDLIEYAVNELSAGRVEAYAHNPEFYEALGWNRLNEPIHNGSVRLARNY